MAREQKPDKFLPAFFVDEIDRRRSFASGELPLRITLLAPLIARYSWAQYGRELREVCNPITPFTVKVGRSDVFEYGGEAVDVKHVVDNEKSLIVVRKAIVSVLGNLEHDTTFDDKFTPHISVPSETDKILAYKDRHIRVEGFSIVEKASSDLWRVVDKIGFKGHEYAPTA